MRPSSKLSPPAVSPKLVQFNDPQQSIAATSVPQSVMLKSAIRGRTGTQSHSPRAARQRFRWSPPAAFQALPGMLPAQMTALVESWTQGIRLGLGILMLFLTWLPPISLILILIMVIADPLLCLSLCYSCMRSIPQSLVVSLRGYVEQWSQQPSMHVPVSGHTLAQEAIPTTADSCPHMCPCRPCPDSPTDATPSLAMMLFAGEGGALLALIASAKAGMLHLGAGGAP